MWLLFSLSVNMFLVLLALATHPHWQFIGLVSNKHRKPWSLPSLLLCDLTLLLDLQHSVCVLARENMCLCVRVQYVTSTAVCLPKQPCKLSSSVVITIPSLAWTRTTVLSELSWYLWIAWISLNCLDISELPWYLWIAWIFGSFHTLQNVNHRWVEVPSDLQRADHQRFVNPVLF